MKIINNISIYDESKQLLFDLYESRLEGGLTEPLARRAMLELKMYHLPPVNLVAPKDRARIYIVPELELFNNIERHITHKTECPSCFLTRPLYGAQTEMCLECWSIALAECWRTFPLPVNNWTQVINCKSYVPSHLLFLFKEPWIYGIETSTSKELIALARFELRFYQTGVLSEVTEYWTTPKKTFMILEIGCLHCKKQPTFREIDWFWTADYNDWSNGYCPECKDFDPIHSTMWGMTSKEYAVWQDSYTTVTKLQRTIARYGAIALLLVSPDAQWANYVTKVVPHHSDKRAMDMLILPKPIGNIYLAKVNSLKELGINLEDLLGIKARQQIPIKPTDYGRLVGRY